MKKIYISVCALAISLSSVAQVASQAIDAIGYSKNFHQAEFIDINEVITPNNSSSSIPVNIIWESDFSNPSDWVLDNDGQNPPDYGWSIDPNADGWWSSNGINSTSGGNFAEVSNGPTSSPAGGVIYTMTTAQPINIFDSIGSGNATLSFEEYGARFYDLQEVQVSTDGINFIAVGDNLSYTMLTQTSGNVAYPNPTFREINIAPYIGNTPTTVWVRFSWTSALALTVNDPNYYNTWIAYGWYIDDVKIAESPANRITMEDEVIGGYWVDYLNYPASGLNYMIGLDYSVTPLSQIQNHPYAIEAVLKNEGTSSQDVTLNYDVTGAATSSGSSNTTTLAPGDSTILSTTFLPTVIGNYSIDIYGTADSVGAGITTTLSNTETRNIEVTDYIYGKDLGVSNSTSSWSIGGPGDHWHFTTRYEMYADEQLYSLRAYITNESVIGTEVKAIIYEFDSTATNGIVLFDESDNYTISSSDLGSWVDIPFVSPINLFSGYAYRFGIAGFQHPTDSVYVGTSGESMYNGEHSLFDEFGLNPNDPANLGTPTWYYLTRAPMVRMNFDPGSVNAITDVKQTVFNTYPNPTNGIFTIELDVNKKYDVTVNNVLGQTVYSGTTSSDDLKTEIDLSNFGKGVYTVELKNNSSTYVEKVIIE